MYHEDNAQEYTSLHLGGMGNFAVGINKQAYAFSQVR